MRAIAVFSPRQANVYQEVAEGLCGNAPRSLKKAVSLLVCVAGAACEVRDVTTEVRFASAERVVRVLALAVLAVMEFATASAYAQDRATSTPNAGGNAVTRATVPAQSPSPAAATTAAPSPSHPVSGAPSSTLDQVPAAPLAAKGSQVNGSGAPESAWATYRCTYITARKDQKKERAGVDTAAAENATFCTPREHASTLVPDEGDVVVIFDTDKFYTALASKPPTKPWLLSVNGKRMGDSALVDGQIARNNEVLLRFRVTAGSSPDSVAFWTSAYQRSGFHEDEPLLIEVGWDGNLEYFRPPSVPLNPTVDKQEDKLLVADTGSLVLALGSGVAVFALFAWTMAFKDLFRIGATPPNSKKRLAYSFARVQWGTWTCFSVIAALYLWAVYGTFPDLTGSVFTLAAVSTLTATTSFFMDGNTPPPPTPSAGLLRDLLSGNNADMQAHRFQALLVNCLLLLAGIVFVGRHLSYPVFPDTWLAMLGISNAGALAGKQLLENQPTKATGSPVGGAAVPTLQGGTPPSVPAGRAI